MERLFQPELGSTIDTLLFENINPLNASLVEDEIKRVIGNWEPRVAVVSVNVVADEDTNSYNATVFMFIGNNTTPTGVSVVLKRSR